MYFSFPFLAILMIACCLMLLDQGVSVSAVGILKLKVGFVENWFAKVDENKDSLLSLAEYGKLLPELDANFLNIGSKLDVKQASEYILEYFRSFDRNQDAQVDFDEFKAGVDQHLKRFKSALASAKAKARKQEA